jgi:uncharacterized protein involved in exopolysaccharide biosynthesis
MPDNDSPRQVTPWVAHDVQVALALEETSRPGLIRSWIGPVRRRWPAGLIVFLAVLGAAAAVLLTAKPVFRADARLRLSEPPPAGGVASPNTSLINLLSMGGDAFANDLELLASRSVAEQIVEDAALSAQLIAPRGWFRDSLFTHFEADRSTDRATFRAQWLDNGRVAVRMLSPRDSAVAEVAPHETVTFGGLTVAFAAARPDMPRTFQISTRPFDDVARSLMKSIQVQRTRRDANVLSIVYDGSDPGVTRGVVEAAVRHFVALRSHIEARESGETVDSIRSVAAATMRDLAEAENALEDWQRRTLLVAPEPQSEAFVERYMTVITELETARMEYTGIDSVLARLNADSASSRGWVTLLSYPRFLENETVGALLARMAELEEKRLELLAIRAETSREFQVLSSQIQTLDASLRDLAARSRTALGERIGDLQTHVAAMDRELARLPGNAVELERRKRDVLLLSQLVVLTEQRLRQEELRQALTTSNVQVIDPPQLQRRQLWPRPKLGAAVGLMLAGVFGLLAMIVAETADPTARTAAQIRALIGAPVLATAVGRKGGVQIAERDAAAVAALAARRDSGTLTLAAASKEDASGVAGALVKAAAASGSALVAVGISSPVMEFGAAAEAADAPVVLVVEAARTRKHDMGRAAARVREAGGLVLGAVVVCRNDREARAVWG